MIYFLRHSETGLIKIMADYSFELSRLIAKDSRVELLGLMHGGRLHEHHLLRRFAHLSTPDERGGRGWFRPELDLIEFIDQYTELTLEERYVSSNVAFVLWSSA